LNAPVLNQRLLDDGVYCFGTAARVSAEAVAEYRRHLASPQYVNPYMSYISTMTELEAVHAMTAGDHAYLRCFLPGTNRAGLEAEAFKEYREAVTRYERIVLMYYLEPAIRQKLLNNGTVDVDKLPAPALDQLFQAYLHEVANLPPANRDYEDDRKTYAMYIGRAAARLQQLSAAEPGAFMRTQ
ncbi:MAG TPA: hypothetical protein VG269_07215, partial [Tepidisphaeraceae bacterium]|nr:hypothetical protein [Tepidisphaeraceae bacterium]